MKLFAIGLFLALALPASAFMSPPSNIKRVPEPAPVYSRAILWRWVFFVPIFP